MPVIYQSNMKQIHLYDFYRRIESEKKYSNYNWKEITIRYGKYDSKYYEVQYCFDETEPEFKLLLAPINKYEQSEFEDLFGFGSHCQNFDNTKIIGIK